MKTSANWTWNDCLVLCYDESTVYDTFTRGMDKRYARFVFLASRHGKLNKLETQWAGGRLGSTHFCIQTWNVYFSKITWAWVNLHHTYLYIASLCIHAVNILLSDSRAVSIRPSRGNTSDVILILPYENLRLFPCGIRLTSLLGGDLHFITVASVLVLEVSSALME